MIKISHTADWLEAELAKALYEIRDLKEIIQDLLPASKDMHCIGCRREGEPITKIHTYGGLCLWHPYYDRARKAIELK